MGQAALAARFMVARLFLVHFCYEYILRSECSILMTSSVGERIPKLK
jgi:hypothetical protein